MRGRAAYFAFTVGALVAACSSPAVAKPYGMGEDLLYRPGYPVEDLSWLVTWTVRPSPGFPPPILGAE